MTKQILTSQKPTESTGNLQIYKSEPNGIDANSKKFHHVHENTSVQ